jgi:hypothetical protein
MMSSSDSSRSWIPQPRNRGPTALVLPRLAHEVPAQRELLGQAVEHGIRAGRVVEWLQQARGLDHASQKPELGALGRALRRRREQHVRGLHLAMNLLLRAHLANLGQHHVQHRLGELVET